MFGGKRSWADYTDDEASRTNQVQLFRGMLGAGDSNSMSRPLLTGLEDSKQGINALIKRTTISQNEKVPAAPVSFASFFNEDKKPAAKPSFESKKDKEMRMVENNIEIKETKRMKSDNVASTNVSKSQSPSKVENNETPDTTASPSPIITSNVVAAAEAAADEMEPQLIILEGEKPTMDMVAAVAGMFGKHQDRVLRKSNRLSVGSNTSTRGGGRTSNKENKNCDSSGLKSRHVTPRTSNCATIVTPSSSSAKITKSEENQRS